MDLYRYPMVVSTKQKETRQISKHGSKWETKQNIIPLIWGCLAENNLSLGEMAEQTEREFQISLMVHIYA